jgi:hypothetical protein
VAVLAKKCILRLVLREQHQKLLESSECSANDDNICNTDQQHIAKSQFYHIDDNLRDKDAVRTSQRTPFASLGANS